MTPPPSVPNTAPIHRPYTHIAKAVVVGDAAVGKTSLLVRYVKGIFNPTYILTIGVSFFVKDIMVGENILRVQLWDTGGQERFGPIRQLYYRGTKGLLLMYDRSNPASFDRLDYWLREIERGCGQIPIILVGNKADLPAVITAEQGQKYAVEHGFGFIETSAKEDVNTDVAFTNLAHHIIDHITQTTG